MKRLFALLLLCLTQTLHAAIAFDATVAEQTSTSWTHTVSGSNGILLVGFSVVNGGTPSPSATYNGVSMTPVGSCISPAAGLWSCLFLLANPAAGANTVSISPGSGSVFGYGASSSYTGALQIGQPDSSANNSSPNATTLTASTTTVADNSWTTMFSYWDAGSQSAASGTLRGSGGHANFIDSNGVIHPAGSASLGASGANSQVALLLVSIAPTNPPTASVSVAQ